MEETTETARMERAMSRLEHLVRQQRRCLLLSAALWLVSLVVLTLYRTTPAQASPAGPDILRVRGLVVVDERGTERVYIGAPVVDPTRFGKRFRRDGPVSGILLFDREGNERGGYVTSDTGRSNVFFTLDSLERQQVLFISPDEGGAHLDFIDRNENGLELGVSEKGPFIATGRGGQVVFSKPELSGQAERK
jgi:hypothetical protein